MGEPKPIRSFQEWMSTMPELPPLRYSIADMAKRNARMWRLLNAKPITLEALAVLRERWLSGDEAFVEVLAANFEALILAAEELHRSKPPA